MHLVNWRTSRRFLRAPLIPRVLLLRTDFCQGVCETRPLLFPLVQTTFRWTHATADGSLSAQYEYTVAVRSQEEGGGCEVITPPLWDSQQQ
jgi:hypothetical protein